MLLNVRGISFAFAKHYLPIYKGEQLCWHSTVMAHAVQCSCVSLLQVLASDLIGATASSGTDVRVWSCVLHPPDLSATKRKRTRCARNHAAWLQFRHRCTGVNSCLLPALSNRAAVLRTTLLWLALLVHKWSYLASPVRSKIFAETSVQSSGVCADNALFASDLVMVCLAGQLGFRVKLCRTQPNSIEKVRCAGTWCAARL